MPREPPVTRALLPETLNSSFVDIGCILRSRIQGHGRAGETCVRLTRVHSTRASLAVVGHVEWVEFAHVDHVPRAGEVVHARDSFEEPAGGGAVAAVQLARLGGAAVLFTSLGEDEHGRRAATRLGALGVEVRASIGHVPTRRALTFVDDAGERTITTIGARLEPSFHEHEDRRRLEGMRATYFTAGDLEALRAARAASAVLVASPRAQHALGHGVALDEAKKHLRFLAPV